MEIVSPSSTFLDYVKKLNLYGDYGVPSIYTDKESIEIGIFEGLMINMQDVFQ